MKALITGAAGFVGSNLAAKLLSQGDRIVGIDSITDYYDTSIKRENIRRLAHSNFDFHEADLNSADLARLLDGVDVVFHEAGQPGVRKSWGSDFGIYTRANVDATQRLLEASVAANIKRFVYASSSSVYGNAERYPTLETDRPQPLSPYGVTKLAAEHLCTLYAANYGLHTVSLRYFTVYGPGQRPDMAFTRFLKAAATSDQITIYGGGEQVRDFTFIDDVVKANILAATVDTDPGLVVNVAGGTSVTVNEVLQLIETISGTSLNVEYIDPVKGDVARTGGSTARIRATLGWEPSIGIEEGLTRQFEWARKTFAPEL